MKLILAVALTGSLAIWPARSMRAQQEPLHKPPAKLADLVAEVARNNPQIRSAQDAWRSAKQVPAQASALPDPQFTLQNLSVGSPRPLAGYTNSDFAYIALGVSQQFPDPGKLRLQGAVAERDADTAQTHIAVVSQDQIESLKTTYVHLAYVQQELEILQRNVALLRQIEQQAEIQYSSGRGNQQDVLRAQLERTTILREISMQHQSAGQDQATLKQILARAQDSADIVAEPLAATFLPYTLSELLAKVPSQNSNVQETAAMVLHNQAAVDLAQKQFRPDFNLSYQYQNTDRRFRDYYMVSVGVNFPRRKPRQAALAQARINVDRAREDQDSQTQAVLADVQRQYVTIKTSEEQLLIYRDGLIPQAQAAIQAGLAAYESNRTDFQSLFSSYMDALNLEIAYQQTLLDHETALIHITRLAGVALP